ncbi:prepilin-type N-terminal cleavage/methylation domain-containing protein [Salmonella enterica subsp. enterica serovar Choleraesuis]|nr:prepilin-type N-terminal cleavage/methylation domain-containing protein [Salmonella enterica subsp. enterica serovar Choleraesuis]
MPVNSEGFTLPEMLIALLLSGLLLGGAMRVLPALQAGVMRASAELTAWRELERLAATLGKTLQRSGYCAGHCQGKGLVIEPGVNCISAAWDENHNGRWEPEEHTALRLRAGSIEIHRGTSGCNGAGWERISAPESLRLTGWQVEVQLRPGWPPRVVQRLSAQPVSAGRSSTRTLALIHNVTGFNL